MALHRRELLFLVAFVACSSPAPDDQVDWTSDPGPNGFGGFGTFGLGGTGGAAGTDTGGTNGTGTGGVTAGPGAGPTAGPGAGPAAGPVGTGGATGAGPVGTGGSSNGGSPAGPAAGPTAGPGAGPAAGPVGTGGSPAAAGPVGAGGDPTTAGVGGAPAGPTAGVGGMGAGAGPVGAGGDPAGAGGDPTGGGGTTIASTTGDCLTVTFTLSDDGGQFGPRNIGAIWVSNPDGSYLRTLTVWANTRKKYLHAWLAASGGDKVDAVSSATMNSLGSRKGVWDCKDKSGNLVAPGAYTIHAEMTEDDATGPNTSMTANLVPGQPFDMNLGSDQNFGNRHIVHPP